MRGIDCGRVCRGAIGLADLLVNFMTMNRRRDRSHDAETNAVASDAQYADFYAIADDDCFSATSRENEHSDPSGGR